MIGERSSQTGFQPVFYYQKVLSGTIRPYDNKRHVF